MLRTATTIARGLALCLPLLVAPGARGQPIGTDIAALNLCLYGDCEARGAYAADPYGWANPATMPVGALPFTERGVFVAGNYYRLNAGRVGVDIEAASAALALSPFVFLVTGVYAEGEGPTRVLPGVDVGIRTRSVRLAAAVDLERAVGLDGFSVGLMGVVPGPPPTCGSRPAASRSSRARTTTRSTSPSADTGAEGRATGSWWAAS
jgi:hypothetical protein